MEHLHVMETCLSGIIEGYGGIFQFATNPPRFIHYTQVLFRFSVGASFTTYSCLYYLDDPSSTYYHPKDKEAVYYKASFYFLFSFARKQPERALNKALSSDWLAPSSGDY
uniref:Uncharacterized protein n=1 Tax=Phlegmariurus squarrosus TaxID=73615 RepID=H9M824_PHLSQ|nr:hypothetical protein HusqMp13 [Phlegmariurus squarrosus]AEV55731.1 hypothetical protein HusqMp13 [Phlegmariurus squarrosus]